MNTLGWIFILCAGLMVRAVSKGRVMNIGEDLSDAFLAIVSGKTDDLAGVLSRDGDSDSASYFEVGQEVGKQLTSIQENLGKNIAYAAVELGQKAKGYRWTATGPDYYDCSGLIWRASQKVGFKGPRFTTSTILMSKGFHKLDGLPTLDNVGNSSKAVIGDIVLWPGHHMGVMTGANKMYSARNPRSGIGETSISGFRKERPIYVRYTGK